MKSDQRKNKVQKWYQKDSVQASLVGGIFLIITALITGLLNRRDSATDINKEPPNYFKKDTLLVNAPPNLKKELQEMILAKDGYQELKARYYFILDDVDIQKHKISSRIYKITYRDTSSTDEIRLVNFSSEGIVDFPNTESFEYYLRNSFLSDEIEILYKYVIAYSSYKDKMYEAALSVLKSIPREYNKKYETIFFLEALCNYHTQRYSEALRCFETVLNVSPENVYALAGTGMIYHLNFNQYLVALNFYNKALQYKPNYSILYNLKGIIFSKLNDHDRALDSYEKALSINAAFSEVYYNIATLYAKQGRTNDALIELEKALKLGLREYSFFEQDPDFTVIIKNRKYKQLKEKYPKQQN